MQPCIPGSSSQRASRSDPASSATSTGAVLGIHRRWRSRSPPANSRSLKPRTRKLASISCCLLPQNCAGQLRGIPFLPTHDVQGTDGSNTKIRFKTPQFKRYFFALSVYPCFVDSFCCPLASLVCSRAALRQPLPVCRPSLAHRNGINFSASCIITHQRGSAFTSCP